MTTNCLDDSGLVVTLGGATIDTDSMSMSGRARTTALLKRSKQSSINRFIQIFDKTSSGLVFISGFIVGVIRHNIIAIVASLGSGVALAYGDETIDGMFSKQRVNNILSV